MYATYSMDENQSFNLSDFYNTTSHLSIQDSCFNYPKEK